MGFVSDEELRRTPPDLSEPTFVGAYDGEFSGRHVTATLVVRNNATGHWDYGPEIPITATPNLCLELQVDNERTLFWSGVQVTVNIDELKDGLGVPRAMQMPATRRPFVVASLAPPGDADNPAGWFACAPLRSKVKEGGPKLRAEIRKSLKSGLQLQDLKRDPFFNEKGKYVARLNDPLRLHYENGRNFGNGFLAGAQPPNAAKVVWHFGIVTEECLRDHGIAWKTAARTHAIRDAGTNSGMVRVPRTAQKEPRDVAVWHALAGKAAGDDEVHLAPRIEKLTGKIAGGKHGPIA